MCERLAARPNVLAWRLIGFEIRPGAYKTRYLRELFDNQKKLRILNAGFSMNRNDRKDVEGA